MTLKKLLDAVTGQSEWFRGAVCSQTDPEVFFPEKGGSTRNAKLLCASCDVKGECLKAALDNDERFGVWGGLSERERRAYRGLRSAPPTNPGVTVTDDLHTAIIARLDAGMSVNSIAIEFHIGWNKVKAIEVRHKEAAA